LRWGEGFAADAGVKYWDPLLLFGRAQSLSERRLMSGAWIKCGAALTAG
jgi:hypothetical protein